jgi:hypothetical protein
VPGHQFGDLETREVRRRETGSRPCANVWILRVGRGRGLILTTETAGRYHRRTLRPGFEGKAVFREGHGLGGQPGCGVSGVVLDGSMPCRAISMLCRCARLGSADPAATDGLPRRCGRDACKICSVSGALLGRRGPIRCWLRSRRGCRRRRWCNRASSTATGRALAAISRRSNLPRGVYEVTASQKASVLPRRRLHLVHRERHGDEVLWLKWRPRRAGRERTADVR